MSVTSPSLSPLESGVSPPRAPKASAADRTVDMFAAPAQLDPERAPEVLQEESKGERVSMEEDANRTREQAFQVQEWSTKYFGSPDAQGNEYRLSHKRDHYYLEMLSKLPGAKSAHGYSGYMIHERDLFAIANLVVAAAREKKAKEAK